MITMTHEQIKEISLSTNPNIIPLTQNLPAFTIK